METLHVYVVARVLLPAPRSAVTQAEAALLDDVVLAAVLVVGALAAGAASALAVFGWATVAALLLSRESVR